MYKIHYKYGEYKNSKAATGVSGFFGAVGMFLGMAGILAAFVLAVHNPLTLIISVPALAILFAAAGKLRRKTEETVANHVKDIGGLDYAVVNVTEEEYQQAVKIVDWGPRHKAVKEIAQMQNKTPEQVIEYYEFMIRNYNLKK